MQHLDVAVAGDDAVEGQRGALDGVGSHGDRRCDRVGLGHRALVHVGRGSGDGRGAFLLPAFRQALLPGEREHAVGFLRELDRPQPGENRHEVGRPDQVGDRALGKDVGREPVEDRGRTGQRHAREQRAARAADAEGDRE